MGFPDSLFLFLSDGLGLRMFCFIVPAFIERFAFTAALAGSLRVIFCDKGIALSAFKGWFKLAWFLTYHLLQVIVEGEIDLIGLLEVDEGIGLLEFKTRAWLYQCYIEKLA